MAQTRQGMRRSERIRNKKATNEAKKVLPPKKVQQRSVRKREQKPKKQSAKQRPVPKRNPPREPTSPPPKPPCSSPPHLHPRPEAAKETSVYHWIENGTWPHKLFEPNMAPRQNLCSPRTARTATKTETLSYDSAAAVSRFLASHNVFLDEDSTNKICDSDRQLYQKLLVRDCQLPSESVFDTEVTPYLTGRIVGRSEIGVVILIHQLLVPPAEIHILRGTVASKGLLDIFNEPWDCSVPLAILTDAKGLPTPQPDHTVGFSKAAFTSEQNRKLQPYLGQWDAQAHFKSTTEMLFPFLMAEAKSGKGSMAEAKNQNAHAVARCFKGVVRLYQLANRVKDLDGRIVAFSIAYDPTVVEIYAHYVVVRDESDPACYRSFITRALFTGSDKWTSYRFVLALYNDWVPEYLQLLCTAIDAMPYKDGSENAAQPIDLSS